MNMLAKFSPELRAWMTHDLDRGCDPADLVQAMLAQGFEPAAAAGLVEARASGAPLPEAEVEIVVEETGDVLETPRLPAGAMGAGRLGDGAAARSPPEPSRKRLSYNRPVQGSPCRPIRRDRQDTP